MLPYAIDNPGPSRRGPVVLLLAAHALALAVSLAVPATWSMALAPGERGAWDWLGHLFIDESFVLLFLNMGALWVLGPELAARLGPGFVPFYFGAGLLGSSARLLATPQAQYHLNGVAPAACALLGAYLLLHPRARVWCYFPARGSGAGGRRVSLPVLPIGALLALTHLLAETLAHTGVPWRTLTGLAFGALAARAATSVSGTTADAR